MYTREIITMIKLALAKKLTTNMKNINIELKEKIY